jgi:cobalt/nickel transport system permease protein
MRLEALERHSQQDAPLQRLDARIKLIATLAFIIAVLATPARAWQLLVAEALCICFVIGLSGIPPIELVRRWVGFLIVIGFLAAMVAPSHPERQVIGTVGIFLVIVIKNGLAFLAVLTLTGVTPFTSLLIAMRRLRVPCVLVSTLQFMYRYAHVLSEELERMVNARRSRNFRRSGRFDWGILTGLIGVLFVRAMERGERVHSAMLARGWNGTIHTLDRGEGR